MSVYPILKTVHMTTAAVTIVLFVSRGLLALAAIDWRRWWGLRVLPHLNDSLLLLSAVSLAWLSRQAPFVQPWLTAKVLALIVYILLGAVALRPGIDRPRRWVLLLAALLVMGYIVGAAIRHDPWSWFGAWG